MVKIGGFIWDPSNNSGGDPRDAFQVGQRPIQSLGLPNRL